MIDIFVGRQPVLARDSKAWGYELLFRSGQDNRAVFDDANQATAQVILNAVVDIGLDDLIGNSRALINASRDFLLSDIMEVLPSERVVLEVLEDIDVDPPLVAGVQRLHEQGYMIALDDFAFEPRWEPLLDLAAIIKVDVPSLAAFPKKEVAAKARELKGRGKLLLAEKVETHEEFEFYRDIGFDMFQGYFFSKPTLVRGSRIPKSRVQVLRLLTALHEPDVQIKQIEEIVISNVDLSYKILRLLNSAKYGLSREISSIHQAIMMLGIQQLRSLATVISLSSVDDKPNALLALSLTRARTCEVLSKSRGLSTQSGFATGLFSTLDAFFDRPLTEVIEELPLAEEIRLALGDGSGEAGQCLRWAIACEQGDEVTLDSIGLPVSEVSRTYVDAINWARRMLPEED
jgi:c-di-GMP phosphodiesterase